MLSLLIALAAVVTIVWGVYAMREPLWRLLRRGYGAVKGKLLRPGKWWRASTRVALVARVRERSAELPQPPGGDHSVIESVEGDEREAVVTFHPTGNRKLWFRDQASATAAKRRGRFPSEVFWTSKRPKSVDEWSIKRLSEWLDDHPAPG